MTLTTSNIAPSTEEPVWSRLRRWFDSSGGDVVRAAELEWVGSVLPNLFGYHIVQLGTHVSESFISSTRISNSIVISHEREFRPCDDLIGRWDALPLDANSIDVLVAPHILEFATEPHAVLREAERVLIGEGHIIIAGFNPWSLCGMWRSLSGWRGRAPWSGRFITASRMQDRLELLGFEVQTIKKTSFRPPLRRANIRRRLQFLEWAGSLLWPFFGNVYLIVARKHVPAVTPLKASWKTRRRLLAGGVAEPSARVRKRSSRCKDPA